MPRWDAAELPPAPHLTLRSWALLLGPGLVAAGAAIGGIVDGGEGAKHRAFQRFERPAPNELVQMDFKGHFPLACGGRCHPLSVLDDHSRFNLALVACPDERGATVQAVLERVFATYGLPEAMLMDNGGPWGGDASCRHTALSAWLIRLGVRVLHGRPRHPQTQGKQERFHRTLAQEALRGAPVADLADAQARFDVWREVYNHQRPHEALAMAVPATRYRVSDRPLPATLPEIAYEPGTLVRWVSDGGRISFQGRRWRVGRAFVGLPVALRPTESAQRWAVFLGPQPIAALDLESPPS